MQIVLYANTHRITSRVAAIHMPELYANLLSVDRVAADWMWKQAGQGICYGHQLPGWIWQICQTSFLFCVSLGPSEYWDNLSK